MFYDKVFIQWLLIIKDVLCSLNNVVDGTLLPERCSVHQDHQQWAKSYLEAALPDSLEYAGLCLPRVTCQLLM